MWKAGAKKSGTQMGDPGISPEPGPRTLRSVGGPAEASGLEVCMDCRDYRCVTPSLHHRLLGEVTLGNALSKGSAGSLRALCKHLLVLVHLSIHLFCKSFHRAPALKEGELAVGGWG